MNRGNRLYYLTGGWFVLTVLVGVYFLFQTMQPSADIPNAPKPTVYALSVDGFEPGQVSTFKLDDVPIVVWRRDFAQQIRSLEQLGVNIDESATLLEDVRATGELKIDEERVLRLEWFVVSPINMGGYGCMVLSEAGDLGGFYDPCQKVHFDLWGQVAAGPTEGDLQILPSSFSENGSYLLVDIADAPRL